MTAHIIAVATVRAEIKYCNRFRQLRDLCGKKCIALSFPDRRLSAA